MSIPFQLEISAARIIRGNFFPAQKEAKGVVIIAHGFKGFKDWGMFPFVAERLAQEVHTLTFNFSHNGVGGDLENFSELEKFAKNSISLEFEDLKILIEHLRQNKLSSAHDLSKNDLSKLPLILLGHSRGAGVSLIYAFDYPEQIAGVVSWNGMSNVYGLLPPDLQEEMRRTGRGYTYNGRTKQNMPIDLSVLEDMETNHDRFDIVERVKTASTPIILIQGTQDFERLREGSAQLVQSNSAIQWIQIAEGDHTFKTVHPFQGTTKPLDEAILATEKFIYSLV